MNAFRRGAMAALALIFTTAMAGCPEAEVDPEPSITFFGVPEGQDEFPAGTDVLLYWQTRLADAISLWSAPMDADGNPAGDFAEIPLTDCIANVAPEVEADYGITMVDTDTGACLLEGGARVTLDEDTVFMLRATAGDGRCERRDVGDFQYPTECDEIMSWVYVAAAE